MNCCDNKMTDCTPECSHLFVFLSLATIQHYMSACFCEISIRPLLMIRFTNNFLPLTEIFIMTMWLCLQMAPIQNYVGCAFVCNNTIIGRKLPMQCSVFTERSQQSLMLLPLIPNKITATLSSTLTVRVFCRPLL